MESKPVVSVIMPVFNGINYLKMAIDSVLCQSYTDFEFLIIDDGSTEDIGAVVLSYQDSRIRFFSRENRGLGNTLNELTNKAISEYIFRMDADDICSSTRLEQQMDFMLRNPDVVMCGGGIRYVVDDIFLPAFSPVIGDREIRSALLQGRFPICHPAIVFRKSAFIKVGGYRLGGAGEDLDFFLRMMEVGRVENVSSNVLNYRISSGSLALKKSAELERGYSYALYSAQARNNGVKEISYSEYLDRVWRNRSFFSVAYTRFRSISEIYYRGFIINKAKRNFISAYFQLAIASFFRINAVVSRLKQYISK